MAAVALVAGDRVAAEDAVQEALVRAWERMDRGQDIGSLTAWTMTVALNLSRSRLRRLMAERRARRRLEGSVAPAPAADDDTVDVERAVAGLPAGERSVVVLRYLLDMNTSEAAEILGVSEGTIKSQLARARGRLSERLAIQEVSDAEPR